MLLSIILVFTLTFSTWMPAFVTDADSVVAKDETMEKVIEAQELGAVVHVSLPNEENLLSLYIEKQAEQELADNSGVGKAPVVTRGSKLTGNNRIIYNVLKTGIEQIAAGESEDTVVAVPLIESGLLEKQFYSAEELGVESIVVNGSIASDAVNALKAKYAYDAKAIVNALLADLPYDFYWFDKTSGYSYGLNSNFTARYNWSLGDYTLGFASDNPGIEFSFYVAKAYSLTGGSGTTRLDTAKTEIPVAAAAAAAGIVNNNAGKNDLEKLTSYKDAICDLTDYNHEAADNDDTPYGDPWQLIYVFDGDESTNVVCEGYSKAFQFLCDLSNFKSKKVESHIVSGYMNGGTGAGPHMWNVVRMNDQKNYIVDVTNCDAGTIGAPAQLFLTGCNAGGSVSGGYVYACSGSNITYTYSSETLNQYDESELIMSEEAYVYTPYSHELTKVEAVEATCTEDGQIAYWICSECGSIFSDAEGENEIQLSETIVEATGHSEEIIPAKEATCTESGLTEGKRCAVCGVILVAQETIPALGHAWDAGVITKEAACTEDGVKTFTCGRCGEKRTEAIEATGHTEETVLSKEATCTEAGLTEGKKCSVCDEILVVQEAIPALGHDWDAGVITKEATCTEDGVKTFTCGRCGEKRTEVIEATGHTEEAIPGKDATCTETGLTEGKKCSVCGEILVAQETIPALGHAWDTGVITKEATCTEDGLKTFTCGRCGEKRTEAIEVTGHTEEIIPGREAACTETGLTEGKKCSVCGVTLVAQETIPALGHTWDAGVITKEATCTEDGVKTYTCGRCGEKRTEAIEATGHTEEIIPGREAACTESGLTEGKKCSMCGEILVVQEIIPVLGHAWDEGVVTKEATCTVEGVKTYTCGK